MTEGAQSLLPSATRWVLECETIKSAVLFGSSARSKPDAATADRWSDVDLHVVADHPDELEGIDWANALPEENFCLQVARAATGGVRKVTAVFTTGQIDMVIVPARALRFVFFVLQCGLNRRIRFVDAALNEMATCLHSGYTFIKGERRWAPLYARVAHLPGVRLDDAQVASMANAALCELLWILQKLERGEIVAAQHALHLKLVDTNLRLWREVRLRRGLPLPSFGLGRRLEALESPLVRKSMSISACATPVELGEAARQCFEGLRTIMGELVPAWRVPSPMDEVLASHWRWPLKPGR